MFIKYCYFHISDSFLFIKLIMSAQLNNHEDPKNALEKEKPTPTHNLTDQQLFTLDFEQLHPTQFSTFEKLSFFSPHRAIHKILTTQYGESRSKQDYIKQNIGFLTTDQNIEYSKNKGFFKQRTINAPIYIISSCTIGAFIIGLWRLPSRMSTVKYTLFGLTTGVVGSYAYWKYSMFEYYGKLNNLFRKITKQRYESSSNGK